MRCVHVARRDELQDMTLIVALKTESSLVMVSDGMGYSEGDGGNSPYPADKLFVANNSWVLGLSGWAGVHTYRKEVEAKIFNRSLRFSTDIDAGAPDYVNAICQRIPKGALLGKTTIMLAGSGHNGLMVKAAELNSSKNGKVLPIFQECPDIAATGSQSGTAKLFLRIFRECATTDQQVKELACFSIWNVANLELTIGQLERGYGFSACVLRKGHEPEIESLAPDTTLERMNEWVDKLKGITTAFLKSKPTGHDG